MIMRKDAGKMLRSWRWTGLASALALVLCSWQAPRGVRIETGPEIPDPHPGMGGEPSPSLPISWPSIPISSPTPPISWPVSASLPISWPRIVSRPVSGVFTRCPVFTGRLTTRWSCHRPRSLPISWPSRTFSRAQRAGACDDAEKVSPASARWRHGGTFAGPTTRLRARADRHYAWRRLRPAHREDAACD